MSINNDSVTITKCAHGYSVKFWVGCNEWDDVFTSLKAAVLEVNKHFKGSIQNIEAGPIGRGRKGDG